jgi:YfiH family protein
VFYQDTAGVVRCRPLERIGWLEHGFGTRHSANWLSGRRVASLTQVHSATSHVVHLLDGCAGEGDALITREPGQMVSVRTADCMPMLMVCTQRRAVAAVHAGWRGTARNIAGETVRRLEREFGVDPSEIEVAIGPGIGECCYEVGPEVVKEFRDTLPDLPPSGKGMLNLVKVNRLKLIDAGLAAAQIYTGAPCTACNPTDFFSYRKLPGEPARMVSAVGIRVE